MKNKKILIAVVALVAIVALMVGAYFTFMPKSVEGAKNIEVVVIHADASQNTYEIATDSEFLRGALEEKNLVAGEESEYGLYVKTVDGYTADDANQEWWCFTKGGEMLMTGVDTTPIADGDTFEATLTVGY